MRIAWDYERLTPEEQWEKEADTALRAKAEVMIVALYKVVGQRWVLIIVEAQSHEEIDRPLMAALPLALYEELEELLPLRAYERFADDVKRRWK